MFTPGLSNHLETQVPLPYPPPIILHTPAPTVPNIKYGHEGGGTSSVHIPDPLVRCTEGKINKEGIV